jgi:NAD(P)-dependent dehydrogenase (short-subunit alcohol dehydrogenase family)
MRNGLILGIEEEHITEETEEVDEVVVVTGGSSGLGQILAEMFALKGISVAVMDIKPPPMEGNYSIEYYECDVSDPVAVQRTGEKITQDVPLLFLEPPSSPYQFPLLLFPQLPGMMRYLGFVIAFLSFHLTCSLIPCLVGCIDNSSAQ